MKRLFAFFISVLFFYSGAVSAQHSCSSLFRYEASHFSGIRGIQPTLLQQLTEKFKDRKHLLTVTQARARYSAFFPTLFADFDPNILSKARIDFAKLAEDTLGTVNTVTHKIRITRDLRQHPLYPVFHAHELTHFHDVQTGRLDVRATSKQILDSEIRAYYQQYLALKNLYSKDELLRLHQAETNPNVLGYLTVSISLLEYPRDSLIALMLEFGPFSSMVYYATGETQLENKAEYLDERMSRLIPELPPRSVDAKAIVQRLRDLNRH